MTDTGAKGRDGGLAIQVLGREYRVGCPPGEEAQITASVEFLNERIRQLRDTGKVAGNEKLAIMAALNIAHDLLTARPPETDLAAMQARIDRLDGLLDQALAQQDNLF